MKRKSRLPFPDVIKMGKKNGDDLKRKVSVAPDGIFLPRRAQARCRWRKTTTRGDLATPTCIPVEEAKGEYLQRKVNLDVY
jgi:hypothetical protein